MNDNAAPPAKPGVFAVPTDRLVTCAGLPLRKWEATLPSGGKFYLFAIVHLPEGLPVEDRQALLDMGLSMIEPIVLESD